MPQTNCAKQTIELQQDILVLEEYIKGFWKILPIPVCSTNPIFTILETGDSFNHLFQYAKDEMVGKGIAVLFKDKPDFERVSKQLVSKGEIYNYEILARSNQGAEIVTSVSALARRDGNNDIIGYIFSFVDITENKRFEKELKERIAELEKFQRLTIGRELKMIELKQQLERAKRYLRRKKSSS